MRVPARTLRSITWPWLRAAALQARRSSTGDGEVGRLVARVAAARADGEEMRWAAKIEAQRRLLRRLDDVVIHRAAGDRTVSSLAVTASKPPAGARLLYRLARSQHSARVVEMGTCLGISGAYLAAGLTAGGGGSVVSLEGTPDLVRYARLGWQLLGLENAAVEQGPFADTYASVLASGRIGLLFIDGNHQEEPTLGYFEQALPHLEDEAVVTFDDISWSDGMRRAWQRIRDHDAVTSSTSCLGMGFVRVGRA